MADQTKNNPANPQSELFRRLTRLFSGPITNWRTQQNRKIRRTSLEEMLHIKCPNEEIRAVLHSLYTNVLNLEHNLFGWCRSMVKFGDFMLYLDIDEQLGVKGVIALPLKEVERLEGEDPTNPQYVQYQWNSAGMTFENWQVAHFRILGNDKYAPYGTSVLEGGRRIWRQLVLMEDAMMAYRIVRSSERRVFYMDVGNIAPQDVEQYIQKTITAMKRNQVVDAKTGRVDLRYNPLSVEEDYFIPVRGGESSRVESLPGGAFTGDIDDVKYLRDKLFAAIKIPPAYLSADRESSEDQTTLAQKDVRFSRTVQRLQRAIISELEKVGIVHLYTLGFRGDDLVSFRLKLNNPSKIAELQEMEHWKSKFEIAGSATENYFSKRWVTEHIFGMSEEEFLRNQREIFFDRKYEAQVNAAAESMAEAEAVSSGAGDLGAGDLGDLGGGDLGDLGDLGGDDLGGDDLGGDDLGGEDLGGEDESALLAAPPAKRDSDTGKLITPKSGTKKAKGHTYTSVKHGAGDQRNGRPQNYRAKGFPMPKTWLPGSSNLKSLGKGIYESKESTYNQEEKLLFEGRNEVKNLIAELANLETKTDENEA